MPSAFSRVAILGLGLIGGSLARALLEKKLARHIAAYNPSAHALDYALEKKFIHSRHTSAADAAANADLVIFAAPPQSFSRLAAEIALRIKPGAILMDVGSVKRQAIADIKPHVPPQAHYVPAHPIAGSEKTGIEAGSAELFSGKAVILTPEESELTGDPVKCVSALWKDIGSRVEYMPPEVHDLIYAYVSHLPHVVAFAAAAVIRTPPLTPPSRGGEYVLLARAKPSPLEGEGGVGGEITRFLRLSKSSPALWAGICLANADYTGDAVEDFTRFATQIYGELKENIQNNEDSKGEAALLFARLVATCLVATASLVQENAGVNPLRYAGTGFADMTAIATGDPEELLAQISAQHSAITSMLASLLERLRAIQSAIVSGNQDALVKLFSHQ